MEIVQEHVQEAKNYIEAAKRLDQLNLINDSVHDELLKRAETQLVMAELYIKVNDIN